MTSLEDKIYLELWEGCGEQLEQLDHHLWAAHVIPILVRMVAHEREKNKQLTDRLNHASYDKWN